MNYSSNYNFKKPSSSDYYNVSDFNDNFDAIDTALNSIESDLNTSNSNLSTHVANSLYSSSGLHGIRYYSNKLEVNVNGTWTEVGAYTHINNRITSPSGLHGIRYYNNNLQYYNTSNSTWTDVKLKINTVYTATLSAGSTSVMIINSAITTNSVLSFYTSVYGLNPKDVSVINGGVTLTFDAQQSSVTVGVRIDG